MSVVGNITSIIGKVSGLTKEVDKLTASLSKADGQANKAIKDVNQVLSKGGAKNLGEGSQGNVLAGALAGFSSAARMNTFQGLAMSSFGALNPEQQMAVATTGYIAGRANIAVGKRVMAMSPFAAGYGATLDTSGIVQQAGQFFQLGRRSGVGNRAGIERATFSAMQGGITSMGAMGNVAQILAGTGFTAGTTNYLGALNQIRNAAISTGMQNEAAAAGIANLQSGRTAATMYQYGITTMNPNGTMRSVGDIARQINRTFASGSPMTAEQIGISYMRGNLGGILQGLNLDQNSQQMIVQALVDLSQGKNPDAISSQDLNRSGNANPFEAMFRMNTSQTQLQIKGEKNTLTGLNAAATTVEAFNNTLGGVITSLQTFKSYLDGVSGTNAGAGIKSGAKSFFSGAKKILGGALLAGGIASSEVGIGVPIAALGAGLLASGGGGRPGYGGSFGRGARGGGNPFGGSSNLVSAGYGMTDTSGIWASTGGKHLGTDFEIPVGTPIYATKDGWVSSDTLDKDYGNAVLIDHPEGYQTLYAHLSKKDVSPGSAVLKGQQIGLSGKSGNTTGPSLHYEVRKGKNNPVDPSELSGSGSPILSAVGLMSGSSVGSTSLKASRPSSTSTSNENLLAVLQKAGFSGSALSTAYDVAIAESGGRSNALNPNASTGDYSMGLFQINMIGDLGRRRNANYLTKYADIGYTGPESLYDPLINAKIAYDISKSGTNWSDAWVNTSRKLGIGGGNPGYGASVPSVGSSGKNVYITVKVDQANEANAVYFANRVQEILDSKNNNSLVGSS